MEFLPNELLELIGISLDIPSIGRLRRTASRFVTAFDDEIFWRNKFYLDYPIYAESRSQVTSWLKRYREVYYWQRQFYWKFPLLIREAKCVANWNGGDWKEIYRDVRKHPLLIYPAINRLCWEIETASNSLTTVHTYGVTHYHLDYTLHSHSFQYGDGIQIDYIATFLIPTATLASQLFRHLRDNNIDVGQKSEYGEHYLMIHGTYVTQQNGAQIWFPRAARAPIRGDLPDVRLDYTCN